MSYGGGYITEAIHTREEVHLEDVGVDERMILKSISKEKAEDVDRTDLACDRDKRLLLKHVM